MRVLPLAPAAWRFRDATRRSPWRAGRGSRLRPPRSAPARADPRSVLGHERGRSAVDRGARLGIPRGIHRAGNRCSPRRSWNSWPTGSTRWPPCVLNGREVARTDNMFLGHRWDVKPLLRPGRNELLIRFGSALEYIRTHRTGHRPRDINDPVGRLHGHPQTAMPVRLGLGPALRHRRNLARPPPRRLDRQPRSRACA